MAMEYISILLSISLCLFVNTKGSLLFCESEPKSVAGDIYFIYILEIHEPDGGLCGSISSTEIQNAISIDWAINKLNGNGNPNKSFIPGIQIGYKIYDDCGLKRTALQNLFRIWDGSCNQTLQTPIAGIIGTTVSQTTAAVADMLSTSHLPMIGVSATMRELTNKTLYPNYISTIPTDALQSKVILDIVKSLKWSYIVGVHTDDKYGSEGFQLFRQLAEESGICIFKTFVVRRNDKDVRESLENFIRTLFIDLETALDENFGGVYYGFNKEATLLYRTVTEKSSAWGLAKDKIHNIHWIMTDGVGRDPELALELQPYENMVIVISPPGALLSDVRDNIVDVLNHAGDVAVKQKWGSWITEYIERTFRCSPAGTTNVNLRACAASLNVETKFLMYDYVTSAFDATYVLANIAKTVFRDTCGAQNVSCPEFFQKINEGIYPDKRPERFEYADLSREMVPELFFDNNRILNVTSTGDLLAINYPLYSVYQASGGHFHQIGNYTGDKLSLNKTLMTQLRTTGTLPTSACKQVCKECRKTPEVPFAYIPGDILLLGLFSLHRPHSSHNFLCSETYSQRGLHALLAFLSAVHVLKDETGINFGVIALDDCYNPLRASFLLNSILSGKVPLKDPRTKEEIDVNRIAAAVGAQSSSVTLSAVQTLQTKLIPLVSYGATSAVLDDKVTYPLFLRTVPSDNVQVKAMVELVKALGVTYVATLNINNNYGRKGIGQFKMLAEQRGICVGVSQEIYAGADWNKRVDVITSITMSGAKVVVYFGIASIMSDLLDTMEDRKEPLIFIGSEAWGTNSDVLKGRRGKVVRGSFTLVVDVIKKPNKELQSDMLTWSTANMSENPWLGHFWQGNFECNLPQGFDNTFNKQCSLNLTLDSQDVDRILTEDLTLRVIEAVYGVGYGFRNAKSKLSCQSAIWPCDALTNEFMFENIKNVNLKDGTRLFTDGGNGNVGFVINNIQRNENDGSYAYVSVGSFSEENGLRLQNERIKLYDVLGNTGYHLDSSCKYFPQCRICSDRQSKDNSTSITQGGKSSEELEPVVIVLAVFCFIALVFLAIGAFFFIRRKLSRRKQNYENTYTELNPSTHPRSREASDLQVICSNPVPCCTSSQESKTTSSSATSGSTTHTSSSSVHANIQQANTLQEDMRNISSLPATVSLGTGMLVEDRFQLEMRQRLNAVPEDCQEFSSGDNAGTCTNPGDDIGNYIHPVYEPEINVQGLTPMSPPSVTNSAVTGQNTDVKHAEISSDPESQTLPRKSTSVPVRRRSNSESTEMTSPFVSEKSGLSFV